MLIDNDEIAYEGPSHLLKGEKVTMANPLAVLQNKQLNSVLSLLSVHLRLRPLIWRHCFSDVLEVKGELIIVGMLLLEHVKHLVLEVNAQVNHLIDFGLLK